MMFLGDLR